MRNLSAAESFEGWPVLFNEILCLTGKFGINNGRCPLLPHPETERQNGRMAIAYFDLDDPAEQGFDIT